MAVKTLNQYKGTYKDNSVAMCNAEDMADAVDVLADEVEPICVQKIGEGIRVMVPDPVLAFETFVDATALSAGCHAYPSGGDEVVKGQKIYLSAVPADGYHFVGWYQGATELSTEAEAAVVVESAAQVPTRIVYEARFAED